VRRYKYKCVNIEVSSVFLLLSAVSSSEAAMDVDDTDSDLEHQLAAQELWSDMIIFSSLTPGKNSLLVTDCLAYCEFDGLTCLQLHNSVRIRYIY